MELNRLAFDCEVKLADGAADGTIEGYASMFNLCDRGGDILLPGAFKATLADWRKRKQNPPMLWQHDSWTPVGVWTDLAEDEKGLKVMGSLVLDVPQASSARALVLAGAVKGLSIGYRTVDYEIDRLTGIRKLKKVELWEVSLVTFPMLQEAMISGAKGAFDPRELERKLRTECGLSSAAAVRAVALVKEHLRDGGASTGPADRDGKTDLLMSLRRTTEALR